MWTSYLTKGGNALGDQEEFQAHLEKNGKGGKREKSRVTGARNLGPRGKGNSRGGRELKIL